MTRSAPETVAKSRVRLAPTNRLVTVTAIVLLPLALLEVARPEVAAILGLAVAALALVAVIDAALAVRHRDGLRVRVRGPVRVVLGREGRVEVELHFGAVRTRWRRAALEGSEALGLGEPERAIEIPEGAKAVVVPWTIKPRRRGACGLTAVHLERASSLGFWAVRMAVPIEGEARVYPNLMSGNRKAAALFLRKPLPGWRQQRQMGRGREFEKLREYLPGDGFDEIHWKATAKRGHPVTKVFQVERTQEVYAVVDASRLSARSAGSAVGGEGVDDTLLERSVSAALVLAVAAERQGDHFGLATFAEAPRALVRARNGSAHFQACREAVLRLQPEPVSPDFREVCTFLRGRLTKRALLVFFTSLDDPALAEAFVEAAALVARRHLVLVVTPLPADARPMFSGRAPESANEVYGRLAGHIRWQGLQDLGARLHRHGVRLALPARDDLATGAVSHYMALKQQQVI